MKTRHTCVKNTIRVMPAVDQVCIFQNALIIIVIDIILRVRVNSNRDRSGGSQDM